MWRTVRREGGAFPPTGCRGAAAAVGLALGLVWANSAVAEGGAAAEQGEEFPAAAMDVADEAVTDEARDASSEEGPGGDTSSEEEQAGDRTPSDSPGGAARESLEAEGVLPGGRSEAAHAAEAAEPAEASTGYLESTASPGPQTTPQTPAFTPPQRANTPAEGDLEPYVALGLGASTSSGIGFLVRYHPGGAVALQVTGGGFTTRSDDRKRAAYAVGGEIQGTLRRGARHRLYLMTGLGLYGDRDETTDIDYGWVDETVFLSFGAGIGGEVALGSRQMRDGFSVGGAFLPVQVRMFMEDTPGNRSAVGPGVGVWASYNF